MPDQNSNPDFLESQSYEGEKKAFEDRRKAVFPAESLTRRPWGLALSGGGIRSATFSLGVLQSLARAPNSPDAGNGAPPLLARFDYLSTVSGGGYTGAFLSSLFRLAGSRGAPTVTNATDVDLSSAKEQSDRAYEALAIEPPGRMTAETTSKTLDHPLRWLRENGRYMAPAGAGDMFYAISLQIRNWCAVHYVIGITLLFAFLTGLSLRSIAQVSQVNTNLGGWPAKMEAFLQPDHANGIWWSPWFWLALAVLALAVVPVGVSYWLTYRPKPNASDLKKHFPPSVLAAIALVALTAILATLAIGSGAAVFLFSFFGWVAASIVIAISLFWFSGSGGAVSAQRVTLTHWLTAACVTALVLVVLGLVETVSQSLYLLLRR